MNKTIKISNILDHLPGEMLSLLSPDVQRAMEDNMRKNKIDLVKSKHPYVVFKTGDGRYKTTLYDSENHKQISVTSVDENKLYLKLYEHYYGNTRKTFDDIFKLVCKRAENGLDSCVKSAKTVREWKNDYKRFFSNSVIINKTLNKITVNDICLLLDNAHKDGISKQRHAAIKTIFRKVYSYSARYLSDPIPNLFETLDYKEWKYEPPKEKSYYDESDRTKILNYLDSLENPRLPQLAVASIFELSDRNGECRALRFDDFDLEAGTVRIQALASGRHRENRVKKDSAAGKRTIILSNRMRKIYQKAKEISWSDEYLFVSPKTYCEGDNILISEFSVCRALSEACKKVGVTYLSPHQIRFSNATQMIKDGRSIEEIQKCLGHTTPEMTLHYIRDYIKNTPVASVDNEQILRTYADII